MTVPSNVSIWQYDGNDVATVFDYTAKVFAKTDLVVTKTNASLVDTLLVVDVDYTVTGVGAQAGGTVVYPVSGSPLATGETITIQRVLPITQLLDLRNQGAWLPENHEDAFDKLTMISQQFDETLFRSLRIPFTEDLDGTLPGISQRASKYLAFDASGLPIASGGTPGALPVSAFMQTMLDDASASSALTTLGVSVFIKALLDDADAATARETLSAMRAVILTRGDLVRGSSTGEEERLAIGASDQILSSDGLDAAWGNPVPTGYRFGCEISRTAVYDVQVAAGVVKSSDNTRTIRLAAPIVKLLDATWAAGTNQGGRPAAVSLTASNWYHVFVLMNPTTGAIDAGFDTSLTATNLLAAASGFTRYRRVGSVLTNTGPSDVRDWIQSPGGWFFWKTPILCFDGTVGTSGANVNLSDGIPRDVKPLALLNLLVEDDVGDAVVYLSSVDCDNVAPSETVAPLATMRADNSVTGPFAGYIPPIRAGDTSGVPIRARSSVAATPIRVSAIGWIDPLP